MIQLISFLLTFGSGAAFIQYIYPFLHTTKEIELQNYCNHCKKFTPSDHIHCIYCEVCHLENENRLCLNCLNCVKREDYNYHTKKEECIKLL